MGTILCYHKQPEINIEIKEEIIKDFPLDTKRHKEINMKKLKIVQIIMKKSKTMKIIILKKIQGN